MRSCILLLSTYLVACGSATIVTVTPNRSAINSGGTVILTTEVITRNSPVASATVDFVVTPALGTVGPNPATTNSTGVATATFTAGAVSENTFVTVEAKSTEKGTTQIEIKPPIGFGDFGGNAANINVNNADVTITPSVVTLQTPRGWHEYTYSVRSNTNYNVISVTFQAPMTVTQPTGGTSANNRRFWQFTFPANTSRTDIVAWEDVNVGGVAMFDNMVSGPPIRHANINNMTGSR